MNYNCVSLLALHSDGAGSLLALGLEVQRLANQVVLRLAYVHPVAWEFQLE